MNLTWEQFKALLLSMESFYLQALDMGDKWMLAVANGPFTNHCVIEYANTVEKDDFEANWLSKANKSYNPAKNTYNEMIVIAEKGNDEFDTIITHDWTKTASWVNGPTNSLWEIAPSSTSKYLSIAKAELQFCHDVQVVTADPPREFYFDVWVGNPLFNPGETPTADDPTFVPGVSTGNPLRFLYKRYVYKSVTDVFSYGNEHFTMDVAVDGMPAGITTVQFNYDQRLELRGDQYAVLRFSTKDHLAMPGSFMTISLVVSEFDI